MEHAIVDTMDEKMDKPIRIKFHDLSFRRVGSWRRVRRRMIMTGQNPERHLSHACKYAIRTCRVVGIDAP